MPLYGGHCPLRQDGQIFAKYKSHLNIICAGRVTWCKFHTENHKHWAPLRPGVRDFCTIALRRVMCTSFRCLAWLPYLFRWLSLGYTNSIPPPPLLTLVVPVDKNFLHHHHHGCTALCGPWPSQANVASDLYPGHPPFNFFNQVS